MLTVSPLSATEVLISGPEALHDWREGNRLHVPGYQFTKLFKQKRWDGTWAPGSWCKQRGDHYELRCSRGLVERVCADLGTPIYAPPAVTALREFMEHTPENLRDYQREAIRAALCHGWGRIALATNAGKGAVIALVARYAARDGQQVLICCDEVAVYDALEEQLAQWAEITPGLVKASIQNPPNAPIVLAMIPTLARRLGPSKKDDRTAEHEQWRAWLEQRTMLLLDEADKATADQWRLVLSIAKNSQWRIGFSGSFPAARSYEDWQLETLMGPVLVTQKNMALVERGISARPTIILHSYDATRTVQHLPAIDEWKEMRGSAVRQWTYDQAVVYNPERHAAIAALIQPDVPTAIIVNRVDHGEQLAAAIPGSIYLTGADKPGDRREVLGMFQRGEFKILIVTKILDRGTNRLGTAADIIFASGEGSPRQILQRIGRGLRRADGKEFLRLVDVIDRVTVHAHQKRLKRVAEYLHGAARQRIAVYQDEGFDTEVVR